VLLAPEKLNKVGSRRTPIFQTVVFEVLAFIFIVEVPKIKFRLEVVAPLPVTASKYLQVTVWLLVSKVRPGDVVLALKKIPRLTFKLSTSRTVPGSVDEAENNPIEKLEAIVTPF